MFPTEFPTAAALTLARAFSEPGGSSLGKARTEAAYALLGHAAALIDRPVVAVEPSPTEPEPDAPVEPADAGPEAGVPKKKKAPRKRSEDGTFSPSDPAPILAALEAHAKVRVKQGGAEPAGDDALAVPPRVLAEYCLKVLEEDLLG